MAYNEHLAGRISRELDALKIAYNEKKMMGGLCYMVNDKMCLGIVKECFMARIDPDFYEDGLKMEHVRKMDFTGKEMKGYLFIDPEGVDTDDDLLFWVNKCLDFNPKAKSSKKKK